MSSDPAVEWMLTADGSPTLHHLDLDETFHSTSGAWSEAKHVFLTPWLERCAGSQKPHWRILDIGFGLGLNWLAFVTALSDLKKTGEIISLEQHANVEPKNSEEFQNWLKAQLPEGAIQLRRLLLAEHEIDSRALKASLQIAPAAKTLQHLAQAKKHFDVILQDPFSPAKNPDCWSAEHFARVACVCEPGTVLLTYSVARVVREHLAQAGFAVQKIPGFGEKREQLLAVFQG